MLDREYLNWVTNTDDYNELKQLGVFSDEEVLENVPVEYDDFEKAIAGYIIDSNIKAKPLYSLCSYFYYYSVESKIYVHSWDDYYDSFHDLELWAANRDIKEIRFSTKKRGPNVSREITDQRLIKYLLKKIFAHDFKMAISVLFEPEGNNISQVNASAFHDDTFELYFFFELLKSVVMYYSGKESIDTQLKRLIMTVLALFKVHTEQSSGNIEELRRKSYNTTEKRSISFWKSYNSDCKKKRVAFRTKYGYLAQPNTKTTPYSLKEREDFYYKYKYKV